MTDDARPPGDSSTEAESQAATPEPRASRTPPQPPSATAVGGNGGGSDRSSLPYILIAVGLLVLLFNLGWWGDVFGSILRVLQLWPVALIAVGADLITKGRYRAIIIVAAVVIGLLLLIVWQRPGAGSGEIREVNVALGAATSINLELDTGVADVNLDSLPGGFSALSGEVSVTARERVSVDWRERGGTLEIEVRSRSSSGPFGFLSWGGISSGERNWDLTLAEDVPTELDIDLGVGDVDLDLADVDLRRLELDAGVGSASISLPHNDGYDVTIDGGVGDVTLVLPVGMPARITVDSGLGRVDFDDSFARDGDSFINSEYRSGSGAALIDVDAGVGKVRIETAP